MNNVWVLIKRCRQSRVLRKDNIHYAFSYCERQQPVKHLTYTPVRPVWHTKTNSLHINTPACRVAVRLDVCDIIRAAARAEGSISVIFRHSQVAVVRFWFMWWTAKWPSLTHKVPTGKPFPPQQSRSITASWWGELPTAAVDRWPVRCALQSAALQKLKEWCLNIESRVKPSLRKSFCAQTGEKSVKKIQNITSHLSFLPQNIWAFVWQPGSWVVSSIKCQNFTEMKNVFI